MAQTPKNDIAKSSTNAVGVKLKCGQCGPLAEQVSLVDVVVRLPEPGSRLNINDIRTVPVWHCSKCGNIYYGRTTGMNCIYETVFNSKLGKETLQSGVFESDSSQLNTGVQGLINSVDNFKLE